MEKTLQTQRRAANISNKQSQTTDNGWAINFGSSDEEVTTPNPKKSNVLGNVKQGLYYSNEP
jgi:hypothetical protein